jgi:2-keto-4-pentenoate hydratase/2-oxohepta-3-ene-1,7-dioic acid hydratase in catechol pathway
MERVYRVAKGGEIGYVAEHEGRIHHLALRGRDLFAGYDRADPLIGGLAGAIVLAPVRPRKFVCIGLNYRDHASEMAKALPANPLLFFKPSTAVLDPEAPILLPPGVGRVDHEAELAVVIGRHAHRVSRAHAWDYVFGITAVNDVTARDMQNKETQYTRCKSFDTFAPIGPCIATLDDRSSPGPLGVEGWVNDECRQRGTTAQLIFPIDFLIEYISFVMTLEPGDVISTGTPAGVGPLVNGDVVTIKVEGVGALRNSVIDEA